MGEQQELKEGYIKSRYEGQEDDYNSMMFRLDPTPTLQTIRRFLRMETSKNEAGEWERPEELKPLFKEVGIEELMAELYARMSVDKVLSNLNENQIRLTVREIGEVIIEFIYSNAAKYEIEECNFNKIFYIIKHNVEIFLRRAKDGKENEMVTKSFGSREVVSRSTKTDYNEDQKTSRGVFGGFGK